MAHLTPIRDAAGSIVGLRPKGADESQFAVTLADTMAAVGAQEAERQPAPPAAVRPHLAMIAGGLVAALVLVGALNLVQRPAAADQPPRSAPTHAPAPPTATRASTVTPTPTGTPTATPEPPTQTPVVIVLPPPPPVQCWTITLDVTDAHGTPIGIATGESCESQDAARANAEAQAEQVRANYGEK